MVGMIPLFAVEVLDGNLISRLPGFRKRMEWFLRNRTDLARHISYMKPSDSLPSDKEHVHLLLAIPSKQRLERVLKYLFDENEFLSPHGIRSLSRVHLDKPYIFKSDGKEYSVKYTPAESDTGIFGGNSNWRGPVWFPPNFILLERLEQYDYFYGESLKMEFPTGSGNMMTLQQAADELGTRLMKLFIADENGNRPCHGGDARFATDPNWKNLILFHEYFDGDNGRGCGASHQTGWTSLVARLIVGRGRRLDRELAAKKGGEKVKV